MLVARASIRPKLAVTRPTPTFRTASGLSRRSDTIATERWLVMVLGRKVEAEGEVFGGMWVGLQNRATPRYNPKGRVHLPSGFVACSLRSMGYAPNPAPHQKAKALPARHRPIFKIHPAELRDWGATAEAHAEEVKLRRQLRSQVQPGNEEEKAGRTDSSTPLRMTAVFEAPRVLVTRTR